MQNCDGTVGDPDCVVTGGTGSPGGFNAIECGSCGCTSTPPPPPPPSGPYWCDNGSCVQTTPPTGAQVFGSLAACNSGCTPPPTASCSHLTMNFTCPDNANFVFFTLNVRFFFTPIKVFVFSRERNNSFSFSLIKTCDCKGVVHFL